MLIDNGNPYARERPRVLSLGWDDFRFNLSAGNEQALGREAKWTVLAYLAADCNLAEYMFGNLLDMKAVASSDELHVLSLFDGPLLADSFMARLNAGTPLGEDLVWRFGELRTNESKTLTMAIDFAKVFPARRRLVLLGGHGSGWRGALKDENAGMQYMRQPGLLKLPGPGADCDALLARCQRDVQDRMNTAREGLQMHAGKRIDILAFDACYMGNLESVVYFADHADLIVVSQDEMPGEGFDYRNLISALCANPDIEPEELAQLVIRATNRFYRSRETDPGEVTLAALRTNQLAPLAASLVKLVQTLVVHEGDTTMTEVDWAMEGVWRAPGTGMIDIKGFVQKILEAPLPREVNEAAREFLVHWDECLVASCGGGTADTANGLSIYAPRPSEFDPAYLERVNDMPMNLGIWVLLLGQYYQQRLGEAAGAHPLIQCLERTRQEQIRLGVYAPRQAGEGDVLA